jgi:hypothetical protein
MKARQRIVAPMYHAEHVFAGDHLSELDEMRMQTITSKQKATLKHNETTRYHYMKFPEDIPLPAVVVDFKHYFSVHFTYLKELSSSQRLEPLKGHHCRFRSGLRQ